MADSYYSLTLLDYSAEKTNTRFRVEEITAGNFATQLTSLAALGSSIDNLTLGTLHKSATIQNEAVISNTLPTDVNAQRERKWLIRYQDTVTEKIYTAEIGTADLTDNLVPNSDMALLTSTDWAAFKTAFEAVVLSPDGNAVVLYQAFHVGRKN